MAFRSIWDAIFWSRKQIFSSDIPCDVLLNRREKVFKGLTIEKFDEMLRPYGLKCTFTDKQIPFTHNWLVTKIEDNDIY